MNVTKRDSIIAGIRERLNDDSEVVRVAAIQALAEMSDVGAIDLLREKLDDKNELVREAAVKALAELGGSLARYTGGFNAPKPPAPDDDQRKIIKEDKP